VIGIVVSNTYPCMAPYGGADRLIGTNPIIMGCPTTDPNRPIVIDISTSGVAIGKVQAYRRENKEMPPDWANDYDGSPTTDPHVAYCVRPMGGHKGYGLAVFVDMFGGVLSDALTSPEIPFVEDMQPEKTGFAVILLDIAHFIDVERFKEHASLYASLLKNSRTATGVKEIFMPGEIEARLIEERKVSGNDYSDALEEELTDLARQSGAIGPAGTLRDLLT
ncbi:MAG: Ldh family oxidoreductase, partial [Oscillospiraceae bacterium]|nr:Ldh family oxidoreductase [Oscillospiraceae bacterium]